MNSGGHGASAGVGRAIVNRFACARWQIGLIARDAEALNEVKREVDEFGGSAVVVAADVSDAGAMFAAAEDIEKAFDPLDVWINVAMGTVFSPVWQITPEEFRRVTAVTYLGACESWTASSAGQSHHVKANTLPASL